MYLKKSTKYIALLENSHQIRLKDQVTIPTVAPLKIGYRIQRPRGPSSFIEKKSPMSITAPTDPNTVWLACGDWKRSPRDVRESDSRIGSAQSGEALKQHARACVCLKNYRRKFSVRRWLSQHLRLPVTMSRSFCRSSRTSRCRTHHHCHCHRRLRRRRRQPEWGILEEGPTRGAHAYKD